MNNQNLLMNQTRKFLNDIVKLCGEWKTNNAMSYAAWKGHVKIVKLCKEWGATDFNWAMSNAAWKGHVEIVKLCNCLLYTSPSPRDGLLSRMPSSA